MMNSIKLVAAFMLSALLSLPAAAQTAPCGPVALVPGSIVDGSAGRWIDSATTTLSGNNLKIGFNTGVDGATWKHREFIASTNAFYYTTIVDTVQFAVTAPTGCYISRVSYAQYGTSSISRIGKTGGSTAWIVDGKPAFIGIAGVLPTMGGSMDLQPGADATKPLVISITMSLFAFSTPAVGTATVSLSGAEVVFESQPRPLQ